MGLVTIPDAKIMAVEPLDQLETNYDEIKVEDVPYEGTDPE
jgi:hypothetical protein